MKPPTVRSLIGALWCLLVASSPAWPQGASQQPPPSPPPTPSEQIVGATHYDGWYTFNGNLENQKYS